MKMKTALVIGATGLVGGELIKELCKSEIYSKVIILTRRPMRISGEKWIEHVIDFNDLQEMKECFKADDIFCCLGTTMKKAKTKEAFKLVDYYYPLKAAELAKQQGAKGFYIISSMGANSNSLFFYNRVKGELEEELKKLDLPVLHIFRPSLLLGNRSEFRFGEKIGEWMLTPLTPLFKGKLEIYKPVQASLVAKSMVYFANSEWNENLTMIHESDEIQKVGNMK